MLVTPIQPPMVSCDAHDPLVSNVISFWSPIAQGTAREEQGKPAVKLSVTMNVLCTSPPIHTHNTTCIATWRCLQVYCLGRVQKYRNIGCYKVRIVCIHHKTHMHTYTQLHTCSHTYTHAHAHTHTQDVYRCISNLFQASKSLQTLSTFSNRTQYTQKDLHGNISMSIP